MIEAVVFDLDGVLIDSEQLWDRARRETVEEQGGRWLPAATGAMQGMSSTEWSTYMHDELGVGLPPAQIVSLVVGKLLRTYETDLPVIPGAVDAVRRIGRRWPLGLASSSNREVIDAVLQRAGISSLFRVTVSSEEVERGKPAPDVYVEVAGRMGCRPNRCCAVEDSANGIRSAIAAGMCVVAVPNPHFPPPGEILELAGAAVASVQELTADAVLGACGPGAVEDRLDEVEEESFPASDSHADWAGPA